jgi:site-specific recombinase XerD
LSLFPKDLDPKAGTIRVLNGKGEKARTIGVDPAAFAVISRWNDERRRIGINGRVHLFCTLTGGRIYTSYIRALFKRLARKAGIEKRVHPHGLRHTFAAQLAAEGYPMNLIQKQLGHSSLATTSRYLDHIAPAQLIEAMQSREWKLEG